MTIHDRACLRYRFAMSTLADIEGALLGVSGSTEGGRVVSVACATGWESGAALVPLDNSFVAIMPAGVRRHSLPLPAAASPTPCIVTLIALGSFFLTLMPLV